MATLIVLVGQNHVAPLRAEENIFNALIGGNPDISLRYRFEHVDESMPGLRDAYASTLRTTLGYNTGTFYGLGLYAQLEDVRVIGNELFNNGGENGITDRAVVPDPEGTEIHQANIRYEGIPRTVLRLGRQEIHHREGPKQRFIGNFFFRQNQQSFDGLRMLNLSLPNTIVDYAYVWNVNRIFGDDNPIPDRANFRSNSHLLRVEYSGSSLAKLESYGYLLDFDGETSEGLSTSTFGLRAQGDTTLIPKLKFAYTGEFAYQIDYAENPNDIDVSYYLGELGLSYGFGGPVESVGVKFSYEVLEGDGGVDAFQTPLGTNHAFQGFADRFLVTPGDGIEDFFVTLGLRALGARFTAIYHDFNSNNDDYGYGTEWDFLVEWPFAKYFLVGFKYADYQADQNTLNVLRNSDSGPASDVTKLWAYLKFTY